MCQAVKDYDGLGIVHCHIKENAGNWLKMDFKMLGTSSAAEYVKKIMVDLMEAGYDGGFSIEPHLGAIIHEDKRGDPEELYEQYIQYGSNLNAMFEEAKKAAVRAV